MTIQVIKIKAAVFDRLFEHLRAVQKIETRSEERLKIKIAMKNIGRLYKEEAEKIREEMN